MSNCETLKSYLPSFLLEDKIFCSTLEAAGNDFDKFDNDTDDLLLQLFPQTATWGLRYWEEFCGIETSENIDIKTRRSKVLSKLSNISTLTKDKFENIIRSFVKDSYIEDINNEYAFRIHFNGEYEFNLEQLRDVVEETKPAHLAYFIRYFLNYMYRYITYLKSLIETKISYNSSVFNVSNNLLLNGKAILDGKYYLNGSIRPDGIKKTFCFITEKTFEFIYKYNNINKINTTVISNNLNSFNNVCSGGSYKFKALNGKYTLNGEINLSNETKLIQAI